MLRVAVSFVSQIRTCCADLDVGKSVPRLNASDITPLQFQQQFVARNKPVVLTGAIEHWPALKLWSAEYLLNKIGDVEVCCSGVISIPSPCSIL